MANDAIVLSRWKVNAISGVIVSTLAVASTVLGVAVNIYTRVVLLERNQYLVSVETVASLQSRVGNMEQAMMDLHQGRYTPAPVPWRQWRGARPPRRLN